ncbi:MAG: hypothetical protein APR54_06925 [Candidatus Cloacimonas sp. SDB]|nr:MAG: hypothetical protein APR54_06925 [Candidatus Cloacimonas sp. SDB]
MNDEPIFSPEYELKNATDLQSDVQKTESKLQDKEANELIRKIEADYELLKPRRRVIRARVIQK